MSKVRVILVLLLAATASYVVTNVDAESVHEAVAAMASLAGRASFAIIAEVSILVAAILAVAFWDRLKRRVRPKSELRVGGSADAAQTQRRR